MNNKLKINNRNFIKYKFLNSLFLGISIGSVFTIYNPLEPFIYSVGGIFLAMAMILVATQYSKLLNTSAFYKISLLVELVILFVILSFLIFSFSYQLAILVYLGYQLTFIFGSYLVRGETLILKKDKILTLVDIAKQSGYLVGLAVSYVFYKILENYLLISDNQQQVYNIHYLLLIVEIGVILFLIKSFYNEK
jgi:putative membrane protein